MDANQSFQGFVLFDFLREPFEMLIGLQILETENDLRLLLCEVENFPLFEKTRC